MTGLESVLQRGGHTFSDFFFDLRRDLKNEEHTTLRSLPFIAG